MSKIKRPEKVPSAMNVNGTSIAESGTLSAPAKKPPPILPPASMINGIGSTNGPARNNGRLRRDAPAQVLGRGQRNTSSRTASMVPDAQSIQAPQPQPYIRTDGYIFKNYPDQPPSLIVHLHPTHFRFDQQDGTFSYKSPMKMFIEHLRSRTVPHDLLEFFNESGVTFYEGCLIVEIHNHKAMPNAREPSQGSSTAEKTEPISIHHSNPYLTPSPWAPYTKEGQASSAKEPAAVKVEEDKPKTVVEKDKENMPAPGQLIKHGSKAKISTVVLHPTQLSQYVDIAIKVTARVGSSNKRRESSQYDIAAPLSASGARPQTPMLAIPATPNMGMDPPPAKKQKREKMEIDAKNVHPVESQITLATTAPLYLEPAQSADEAIAVLEVLKHPDHCAAMPSPKMRKKTVAEVAAEESATRIEEKFMLLLDDRYSTTAGGAAAGDVDGQVGGASFEPRFERFKAIENIRAQVQENKRREKIAAAEQAKREKTEADAKEQKEKDALKRTEEQLLLQRQMQQRAAQQTRQQDIMRQQMALQNAKRAQAMANAGAHGHPVPNMGAPNGMNPQQRFMAQNQIPQGGSASPVVRNATPQNMSSPMVGQNMGVPMQTSTSSMGGSPPRPGSVVPQGAQMSPQMAQAMRTQISQHSQGGTPIMANGTPNMAQNMSQMNQTPRMTQPSPRPGQMAQAQQMGMLTNQNIDPHVRNQILQQQQQQRMRQAAIAQAQGVGQSPVNGQMTQQQQILLMQQQQQMQQGNAAMMGGNAQLQQQYAARVAFMQAQQAQLAQNQQNVQNGGVVAGRPAMTPRMVQQAQQQAATQAQQQAQNGGQNPMAMEANRIAQRYYQQQFPAFAARYNGNVPPQDHQLFKQRCQQSAMKHMQQLMQQRRLLQAQQQGQIMANQQGGGMMVNGMNGNMMAGQGIQGRQGMNGMGNMGMQRPPGM